MGHRRKRRPRKVSFRVQVGNTFKAIFSFGLRVLPLVVIVSSAGGAYLGLRSALYADTNLNLSEISVYPQSAIPIVRLQALQSQYLGKNLLSINLRRVANELEKDPNIKTATIIRNFPSRLIVEVNSRLPIGYIRLSQKEKHGIISRDGIVLEVVETTQPAALFIDASELNIRGPYVGQKIVHPAFSRFLTFWDAFNRNPISQQLIVSGIRLDRFENLSILLRSGQEVRLGHYPIDRIPALNHVIPIINTDDTRVIEYIDLQYDDVIVKRKG